MRAPATLPSEPSSTAGLDEFLADSESLGAAIVSREGRVLECNRALQRLVGTAALVHETVASSHATVVSDLVARAGPQWRSVLVALQHREDGTLVDCKLSAVERHGHVLVVTEQLRDPVEKLSGLLLELNADLLETRRELAAQNHRLRELDELKSLFLASVTHDLKQPLASLIAYAELLGEERLPPDVDGMAHVIQRNALRMSAMLNDLQGAAAIMTGDLRLELRPADLVALVHQAVDAIRPSARAGQVTVSTSGAGVLEARVDELRVLQILDNLLSNAVKYCPGGGQVLVSCESRGGTVVIEVSDDGIGIPRAEQDRLFDRYFRASTALGRGIEGTGIGLANAHAFAEAHGGTLTCTSEAGVGSTFTLVLPVAPGTS